MQLKRDTDFALRILFCIKQNQDKKDAESPGGLTLTEIAKQTGVPKLAAGRICDRLQVKGMIRLSGEQEHMEKTYSSTEELLTFSLLDIIEAVEGTGQLFAVFNRNSSMYRSCRGQIMKAQKRAENALAKTTLDILFGSHKQPSPE